MSSEEKKGKGFVFVDKRKTQEEERGNPEKAERPAEVKEKVQEPPKKGDSAAAEEKKGEAKQPLPEVDFNFFILSLSSSAMMQMGVIPNPVTKSREKNLDLAKQTIDIIALLEKKTEGNLTAEEKQFIEAILYDLRMKYVEVSK